MGLNFKMDFESQWNYTEKLLCNYDTKAKIPLIRDYSLLTIPKHSSNFA